MTKITETNLNWLDIKKHKPYDYQRCFVYKTDAALICFGVACWTEGRFLLDTSIIDASADLDEYADQWIKGVTHWMPIPNQPKK